MATSSSSKKRTQPEVENLDHALAVYQDISRLDITVNECRSLMSMLQSERRLPNVADRPEYLHRPVFIHHVVKTGAIDIFHHQEMEPVVFIDVVSADDVGVVEGSDRPCLAVEPLQS